MWDFCIKVPAFVDGRWIGEKKICLLIPILPIRFPPEPMPPDSWIRSELFEEQFLKDVHGLAAIDQLAADLSPYLRTPVQHLVRTAAKDSKMLPANVELHFDRQSHRG